MSTKNEPVLVRMTPDMLAALDEYRKGLPSLPTRPEAVRQLVSQGLTMRNEGKTTGKDT